MKQLELYYTYEMWISEILRSDYGFTILNDGSFIYKTDIDFIHIHTDTSISCKIIHNSTMEKLLNLIEDKIISIVKT